MTLRTVRKAASGPAHRSPANRSRANRGNAGHRRLVWAALLVLTGITAACSGPDKALSPPTQQEIHAPVIRAVTVTDAEAGAPVTLGHAQELVVRLPTAVLGGSEWSIAELQPPGVLAMTERRFERAPRGVAVEAEGDSVWHFKPVGAGSVGLRFELRRPHSLEPAALVVTYVVTVQPATAGPPPASGPR